jgi:hypothetical protein
MTAPDFDPEFNLHRAKPSIGSLRMRMEAWVEGKRRFSLTRWGRLMEVHYKQLAAWQRASKYNQVVGIDC